MLLQTKGWHDHHLWLPLFGIYVCTSVLYYGCAVWGPAVLSAACSLHVNCTGKRRLSHCSAFRAILGMKNGLHNDLVYILAGECHLQLHIVKQVYQFVKIMKDNPHLVSKPLVWL